MVKVTIIFDNQIASPMSPVDFVNYYYLTEMAKAERKYIEVVQGDNFFEMKDDSK
jgi:hypothetical protein